MARLSRKELKKDEIAAAAFDFGHWVEANWRTMVRIAIPIVIVALLVAGWFWNERRTARQSSELLAQGIGRFTQAQAGGFSDSTQLGEALDFFDRVHGSAGGSSTGQLALYYQGVTLQKLGRTDDAISSLESVQLGEDASPTLGAAKALLADLLVEAGQTDRAIELLVEVASRSESAFPPEMALLQLGRIYHAQGNGEQARESWTRVVDEYPQSPAASRASQLLGS